MRAAPVNLAIRATQRSRMRTVISLGLIVILIAMLRFYELGTESYWMDEITTVRTAQESLKQLLALISFDRPPYILCHSTSG